MADRAIYDTLAVLLRYPETDYARRIAECLECAAPDCCAQLKLFGDAVRELQTDELQELFTRTFDLNPLCSLELGWHLFGENYERGVLLVRMREELRRHKLSESHELPDHLTHILQLVGKMEHEYAADFVAACVQPALEKMLQAIHDKENPFEHLLLAVKGLLQADFPELPPAVPGNEPVLKVLA